MLATVTGDGLTITDNTAWVRHVTVSNVGITGTATSLGIVGTSADGEIVGSAINYLGDETLPLIESTTARASTSVTHSKSSRSTAETTPPTQSTC